ncbi:MAG TPA: ATP-binding protein [Patescibacteria group bacterium]|nr:ATP-binding protein [Patescibacteria group bacterium]
MQSGVLLEKIKFATEKEAYEAASLSEYYAKTLGFKALSGLEIKMAVSELAINAVRYARGGEVEIHSMNNGKILEVCVRDFGGGIRDIDKATTEGFSTTQQSLGIGLNVARRSVDEFFITTEKDIGTAITLKKFMLISHEKAQYGIVSLADEHYTSNGDAYVIKEFDGDKILLAVIDGLGQGDDAAFVANIVKQIIERNYRLPLQELIVMCDKALRQGSLNSGVAMSLILIANGEICYAGVGDTHTKVFMEDDNHYTLSQKGLVGNFVLPQVRVKKIKEGKKFSVIMCTDGIQDHFRCENLPKDTNAQELANFIFNNYHRSYGDATVLVAKINDL